MSFVSERSESEMRLEELTDKHIDEFVEKVNQKKRIEEKDTDNLDSEVLKSWINESKRRYQEYTSQTRGITLESKTIDFQHLKFLLNSLDTFTDYSTERYDMTRFIGASPYLFMQDVGENFMRHYSKFAGRLARKNKGNLSSDILGIIRSFEYYGFREYLDDILESCSNKKDTERAFNHLRENVFKILQEFQHQGIPEMIPYYIQIRKYAEEFSDSDTERSDIVKPYHWLKNRGDKKDIIAKTASEIARTTGFSTVDEVKTIIDNLKKAGRDPYRILKEAEVIFSWGVNARKFIDIFHVDYKLYKQKHIHNVLTYVKDLSTISPSCASSALDNITPSLFDDHPIGDRNRVLNAGMALAQRFGDDATGYFEGIDWERGITPRRFNRILNAINEFGEAHPDYLYIFANYGVRVPKDKQLEEFTQTSIRLIHSLKAAKANNSKLMKPIEAAKNFFSIYDSENPILLGVDPKVYSQALIKFYKEDRLGNLVDSNFTKFLWAGAHFEKITEILNEIKDDYMDDMIRYTIEIINSPLSPKEKIKMITDHKAMCGIIGEYIAHDMEGRWKSDLEITLKGRIMNNLDLDPAEMDFDRLLKIGSLARSDSDDDNKPDSTILILKSMISHSICDGTIKKNFSYNHPYPSAIIGGVKDKSDPVMLTQQLIYGIISKDENKRNHAENYFEKEKLDEIREFIGPKLIYNLIKDHLPGLESGSLDSAQHVLKTLKERYRQKEAINDLVNSIEGRIFQNDRIDKLIVRLQKGTYEDLFDNRRNMCCAFYPTGVNRTASINYVLDENIGLLHLVPVDGQQELAPIGAAICMNVIDDYDNRYLFVDGVEAGPMVDRIRSSIWMPLYHEGIIKLAKESGNSKVIYNTTVGNMKPNQFVSFLESLEHENDNIKVRKVGGTQSLFNFYRTLDIIRNDIIAVKELFSIYLDTPISHMGNRFLSPVLETQDFSKGEYNFSIRGHIFDSSQ